MIEERILLNKALTYGLIDIDSICCDIEMYEKRRILNNHPYSIWRGKNNKWYTKVLDEEGNKKLVKRSTRADIENFIVDNYNESLSVVTLGKVFDKWIEQKVRYSEIANATIDRYKNAFEYYFGDTKNTRIADIDEDVLEDIIRSKISDLSLSAKAYGNMKTLLIGIFKYAKKHLYTEISISSFFGDLDISRKVFNNPKKEACMQVFTREESQKIMNYLYEHPSVENYGIILTFYTGLREGELAALKFSDVQGNKLHIQRQQIRYKSDQKGKVVHKIVEYTKSEAGDRYVILTKEALDIIDRIKILNPEHDLMMVNEHGKILTTTFNHRLYRACEECDIPKRSMHKIRKTYGTMLIDKKVEDSLIMNQMGHSDITTTRKYYYFYNGDDDHKVKQIENAICF